MNKGLILTLVVVISLVMAMTAFAVPSGKTVEFTPAGAGKVVFDGKAHATAGLKCSDCHPGLFKMKKGADTITMADMNAGKFCGSCHNGTKAFATKDAASCGKCHQK
ncbi:MAG TPA: cytochrome c3 family protein [Nitrospirota bacterium]|nr:cytochrome c3 family protein [Nitrospirota bacterium]